MRIIDPHLHTDRMKGKDIETLSIAGVEGAILPTPHLLPWLVSADTMFRMWDNFLEFQVRHQASLGIHVRVTVSIPFYGLETEAVDECLKRLPEYLRHENAVGLGEIGMDAGLESEERLFRAHLNLAKENNMPVIIHTPTPLEPQAVKVLDRIVEVINQEKFPIERAILDHTGRNTLSRRLDSGAMVGLSLCYDKLRPEDAAEIVAENQDKLDRLVINSEFGYAAEGYFSVPRAVLSMRRLGLKRDVIEKVTWDNPREFFGLNID
ncbi:MAG: TatD family hydrolase [Deltaproteobacteria bacterium]|nr:TatD family hydrolase [Deltaproteobacteria bacterium]